MTIAACGSPTPVRDPIPTARPGPQQQIFSGYHGVVAPRLDSPASEGTRRHLITEVVALEFDDSRAHLSIDQEVETLTRQIEGRRDAATWIQRSAFHHDVYEGHGTVTHTGTQLTVSVRVSKGAVQIDVELTCERDNDTRLTCVLTTPSWPRVYRQNDEWHAPEYADKATFTGRFELPRR
jgi:hypothetical protein